MDEEIKAVALALQERAKSYGVSSTISACMQDNVMARELAKAAIVALNHARCTAPAVME